MILAAIKKEMIFTLSWSIWTILLNIMNKVIEKVSIIWTLLLGILSWVIIIGGSTIAIHLLRK
jgi:hypothetical protein